MGAHYRMRLSIVGRYMLSFRELSSSAGDLDFTSFMLRPSLGFGQAESGGGVGGDSGVVLINQGSGSPLQRPLQSWEHNCSVTMTSRIGPKQSNQEGQVSTFPRPWQ